MNEKKKRGGRNNKGRRGDTPIFSSSGDEYEDKDRDLVSDDEVEAEEASCSQRGSY